MPHKYLRIDGVATYIHHTGATTLPETPPDTSQGEVLLCLHGTGGHGGDFALVLEALESTHSPIAFDQPGHGRSGGLDSLGTIARMRDFTVALTAKLGLRPHVVMGHSLGAAVALDYALEQPEVVRGLVICSGGGRFTFPEGFLADAKLVTQGKRRRDFDPTAFAGGADPKIMRRAFMAGTKTDPRARYGDLLALNEWRREDDLPRIEAPTLVIHGDAESQEGVAQADALVDLLPNARKEVVAKAGRMVLYEQPEALSAEIGAFLGGLS